MPVQNQMMYNPPTYNPINLPQRPFYGQQQNYQPNLASLGQNNSPMTGGLIDQLRPAAVPAFQVPNPYANYGFGCYCNNNVA